MITSSGKTNKKYCLIIIIAFAFLFFSYQQKVFSISKIDSLEVLLLNSEESEKVSILCELSKYYVQLSPVKAAEYAEQAFSIAEENKNNEAMIMAAKLLYEINYQKHNFNNALETAEKLIRLIRETKDIKLEAECLDLKAYAFAGMHNYIEALKHFSSALNLRISVKSFEGIGDSYVNIAKLFAQINDYATALEYIKKAILEYENSKNEIKLAEVNMQAGIMYSEAGQYTKGVNHLKKALIVFEESDDKINEALCSKNLGICYLAVEEFDKAELYLRKALEIFEKNNDISETAYINNFLGKLNLEKGNLVLANTFLKKSIQLHEEKMDKTGIAGSENIMGILQKKNGNFSSANIYFLSALKIFKDNKSFEPVVNTCKELIDINLRQGNYNNAVKYNSLLIAYTDSILLEQERNNQKVKQLITVLNELDRDKAIDNKNAEIDKIKSNIRNRSLIFYTAVIISILLLFFSIILLYKNRKRAKELLLLKEKSNEIEKKFEARSKDMQEKINEKIVAEQTRDMLNTVLEQVEESVIITNLDKKIIYVNNHFEKMTGFTRSEVQNKIPDYLAEGKLPGQILSRLSSGKSWKGNLVTKLKKGGSIHEEAIIFPLKNMENKIKYYAAIKRDISENIIYNEVIEKSEAIMNSLLVHHQNSVLLIDHTHNILIFNPKAKKLCKEIFGDDLSENDTVLKYIPQDELKNFKQKFEKVFEGESKSCEKTMKVLDDKEYNLIINLDPVETEDRKVLAVLLTVEDKTGV